MNRYLYLSGAARGALLTACLSSLAVPASGEEKPETIVVTASPLERQVIETIPGTSVITGEELARRLEGSIGETLRREPGISSTFFGPGASRPIIRGLGGDRISVLDTGLGSIDASSTSVDHAVAVEPAQAERIEIVRGTAMLLYGSSAAGGVVNVFDGRIPDMAPGDGVDAALRYGHSPVDNGDGIAAAVDAKLGSVGAADIVLHVDGGWLATDDYEIPGFAESAALRAAEEEEDEAPGEEHEEAFGIVENSDVESAGGAGGLSLVFPRGFIGVSGRAFHSDYGAPGHHHHEEEGEEPPAGEEEVGVRINLDQARYDLHGEYEADMGPFRKVRFRMGYGDYEHREIEPSGEVGTVFTNEGLEGRAELLHKKLGALGGAAGVHWRLREFAAIGEEAFVPPTDTTQIGVFVVEEYKPGRWRFDLGGRYESTNHTLTDGMTGRSFDGVSVSGGAGYKWSETLFAGLSVFRTERAPATEELFAGGPHLATSAFEVGDPDLGLEKALGVEAAIRGGGERLSFTVNGFYTSYKDFIFAAPTGEEEDGLPVFAFRAADARFAGFEAEVSGRIARFAMGAIGEVELRAGAALDYVRATTDEPGNDNLPRIPPFSGLIGVEAASPRADLRLEAEYAAAQDEIAEFELPTDGYTLFNAFLTLRPSPAASGVSLRISGLNLTNEEAREHTSFLKDLAPLPGRNVRVALRAAF